MEEVPAQLFVVPKSKAIVIANIIVKIMVTKNRRICVKEIICLSSKKEFDISMIIYKESYFEQSKLSRLLKEEKVKEKSIIIHLLPLPLGFVSN
ncbi:hypothetical protein AsFPU1_3917 [Aphanothece sacrum FPU1]|uniref:Uncharacterized protein n=1 Tax=Aphanothece sacrum FPU1 TaxID=1920663 RepID=A0A401IMK7_APHSA|nr:hypothetical protein AsFPU1_3917 [Aphanothece sacrum FPU1]GBF85778.1 hypothetical protein AsFPU3_2843 [Aphanothece sacrum FPU3]